MPYEIKTLVLLGIDDAAVNKAIWSMNEGGDPWELMGPPTAVIKSDTRHQPPRLSTELVYTLIRRRDWTEAEKRQLDEADRRRRPHDNFDLNTNVPKL